jgi:hypothetical protein
MTNKVCDSLLNEEIMIESEEFRYILGAMREQNMLRAAREEGQWSIIRKMLANLAIEEVTRITGLNAEDIKGLHDRNDRNTK